MSTRVRGVHEPLVTPAQPLGFRSGAVQLRGLGARGIRLGHCRQSDVEAGTGTIAVVARPDASAVALHDRLAHRQAQAHAAGLAGHERLEHILEVLWCDAGPDVADSELDL